MMNKHKFLKVFSLALLGTVFVVKPVMAAINFDTGGTITLVKDLVRAEAAAEELIDQVQSAASTLKEIGSDASLTEGLEAANVSSVMPLSGNDMNAWPSIIPQNVQPTLKVGDDGAEPDVTKVREEIEKIAFIKTDRPELEKLTKNQQNVLLLKVASYGYAAATRSFAISENAVEENAKMAEEVANASDHIGLWNKMAKLQLVMMHKQGEIMHLRTRMLESISAQALVGHEALKEVSDINVVSESSSSDAPTQ
jgi:hypothetical protein